ncbi:unnamed protein product [Alopecurus aequalis]
MSKKASTSSKNPFSDLTDDLLRHVVSFLPPEDVLQTCVLDTRWRDHWRRTTDLLHDFDEAGFPSSDRFKQLVKLFIHLRGNSPLDKYEIYACRDEDGQWEGTYTNTMLLVEYALKCQVKELLVAADYIEDYLPVFDMPLISQRLKTIHLVKVYLEHPALNFSCCPVLEDLKMEQCRIHARKISSKSLKRLCITYLCSFSWQYHTRIFAPALTELQLNHFEGFPPFLEYMPFLVTAYVGLNDEFPDFCHKNHHSCGCHGYPVEEAVFLNGLSNAVNLELISESEMSVRFIYRRDLEWCPIFDKLKTLLLNGWFRAADLVCILQHSPILETLTLQLGDMKNLIKPTEVQETTEQPCVCAHLKVVNIECSKVDEGTHTILKILMTCGILRDSININARSAHLLCFSFQKGREDILSFY